MELKRQLSFIHVFCIAAGAMISSGIFILPGLAFAHAGPAVFLSYLFAGVLALAGVLSLAELSTAMPKAGGDYYYVTRSLGPLTGTISGVFSWVAISLKSAFAIFGMAEILHLLTGLPLAAVSLALCGVFVLVNIRGVREAAGLEVGLVLGLLALMAGYVALGWPHVRITNFQPFMPAGLNGVLATSGFVFVSFGGLFSIASVAEEVKDPRRNIPLGLISAVAVVTAVYTVMLFVTVGVLPAAQLRNSLTPIADTARVFSGRPGYSAITVAAALAFVTTAIAGILSASRYPLALSRDRLLPPVFGRLGRRSKTPVVAIAFTGGFIAASLQFPLDMLVRAASTVILTANVFAAVAVIILRESRLRNYRPSFRVPLYPYLQIAGIVLFGFLIADMGLSTVEISAAMLALALLVYILYGRARSRQEYALLHLVARIANKRLASRRLEGELLDILHERDGVVPDDFDKTVESCPILDLSCGGDRRDLFRDVAERLAPGLPVDAGRLAGLLEERERESSTAITPFVAIPHLVVEGDKLFRLAVARCRTGVRFSDAYPAVRAVFVIVGSIDARTSHLRALAAIAQIVRDRQFEKKWRTASGVDELRDTLLLSDRRRVHLQGWGDKSPAANT